MISEIKHHMMGKILYGTLEQLEFDPFAFGRKRPRDETVISQDLKNQEYLRNFEKKETASTLELPKATCFTQLGLILFVSDIPDEISERLQMF